jgi:hypothetical protein
MTYSAHGCLDETTRQLPINAVTGQVEMLELNLSGKATYRGLGAVRELQICAAQIIL